MSSAQSTHELFDISVHITQETVRASRRSKFLQGEEDANSQHNANTTKEGKPLHIPLPRVPTAITRPTPRTASLAFAEIGAWLSFALSLCIKHCIGIFLVSRFILSNLKLMSSWIALVSSRQNALFTYSIFCLALSCLTFSSASAFSLSIHASNENGSDIPGDPRGRTCHG